MSLQLIRGLFGKQSLEQTLLNQTVSRKTVRLLCSGGVDLGDE